MLDTFELPQVQAIEGAEREALQQHGVPALEGDFLQDLGRRATRVALSGVLTGAEAADQLRTLREKHRAASPIPFVADIATATTLGQVLIEELGIRELAGRPERFEYAISLIEYAPATPPSSEQPPQPAPPPPPPPPPSTTAGTLLVTVIVDDDPSFDVSTATVTVAGTQDDGTVMSTTMLTDRAGNVWTNDPTPAGSYTASAAVDHPPMSGSAPATVVAGQTTRAEIHLRSGPPVAHAFVVHYWFDKAFIEPCLRGVLRDAAAYAQAHPDQKMLIVGHTDLAGSATYNQSLSERRARGAYAYLTAGRAHDAAIAEWDQLRRLGSAQTRLADNWGVREYQLLLAGLGYYGGPVDEIHGPLTDAAVRNFQTDHALSVDGVVGDQTWLALIDAYLKADALSVPESQFLPNCPGDIIKWLGSGEQDPVNRTEDAWRPNRRTEILFITADALAGKAAPPATFNLPAPGAVNASWCAGAQDDPVVVLSRTTPQPGTFFVQPAEAANVTVKGKMTFEDGSPAAGIQYVITAPDGEYLDGERPQGPDRGRPIPATTDPGGSFGYPDKPKGAGIFSLTVIGAFTVRLASDPPGSGAGPTVCTRLDGTADLNVVLAPADGVDPRRKLSAIVYDRTFQPRTATGVGIEFPDGTAASATTDARGRFTVTMGDAYPAVRLRYAASDAPGDEILFQDYFIDPGDIATDDGVSRRLHNLGLLAGGLTAAITRFQSLADLPVTGKPDTGTRTKLDRVYRGDEPPVVVPPADTSGPVGPLTGDGPPEADPRFAGSAADQPSGDPFGAQ
jgi:outer membrane protein OmpA-like peptidoglycan-associated protein